MGYSFPARDRLNAEEYMRKIKKGTNMADNNMEERKGKVASEIHDKFMDVPDTSDWNKEGWDNYWKMCNQAAQDIDEYYMVMVEKAIPEEDESMHGNSAEVNQVIRKLRHNLLEEKC